MKISSAIIAAVIGMLILLAFGAGVTSFEKSVLGLLFCITIAILDIAIHVDAKNRTSN